MIGSGKSKWGAMGWLMQGMYRVAMAPTRSNTIEDMSDRRLLAWSGCFINLALNIMRGFLDSEDAIGFWQVDGYRDLDGS